MPSGVYVRTEKCRQSLSVSTKLSWQDNATRQLRSKNLKIALNKHDIKMKRSEAIKRAKNCECNVAHASAAMKIVMQNNDIRNKISDKMKIIQNKPDVKKKLSKQAHERMESGKYHVTDIERIMFEALTKAGYNFKRNKHIENIGNVDFLLTDCNIIIECDGEPWHSKPNAIVEDSRRDTEAAKLGYRVLRFKGNAEIKCDIDKCIDIIRKESEVKHCIVVKKQ